MGKSGEASTHFGGQLGLVGLVLMSSAAASLALVSVMGGDDNESDTQTTPTATETSEISDGDGDGDIIVNPETILPSAPAPILEPATSHTDTGTTAPVPVNPPVQADPVMTAPAPAPIIIRPPSATDRPVLIEPLPGRLIQKADFIVRFKGVPEIDQCLETYKTDPVAGQAKFDAWARDKPELSGITLTGVTYSGEAILTYRGAADNVAPVARVSAIGRRIQSVEGVRYADPDYTAQPGKGD